MAEKPKYAYSNSRSFQSEGFLYCHGNMRFIIRTHGKNKISAFDERKSQRNHRNLLKVAQMEHLLIFVSTYHFFSVGLHV